MTAAVFESKRSGRALSRSGRNNATTVASGHAADAKWSARMTLVFVTVSATLSWAAVIAAVQYTYAALI